jgi:hypothetical protein
LVVGQGDEGDLESSEEEALIDAALEGSGVHADDLLEFV